MIAGRGDANLILRHMEILRNYGGEKFVWLDSDRANLSGFYPITQNLRYNGMRKYTYSEVVEILSEALCLVQL